MPNGKHRREDKAFVSKRAAMNAAEPAVNKEAFFMNADLDRQKAFETELTELINKHSLESGSNTADYILAAYLVSCLFAYEATIQDRSNQSSPPTIQKDI
jgi:hypothetical protein